MVDFKFAIKGSRQVFAPAFLLNPESCHSPEEEAAGRSDEFLKTELLQNYSVDLTVRLH